MMRVLRCTKLTSNGVEVETIGKNALVCVSLS